MSFRSAEPNAADPEYQRAVPRLKRAGMGFLDQNTGEKIHRDVTQIGGELLCPISGSSSYPRECETFSQLWLGLCQVRLWDAERPMMRMGVLCSVMPADRIRGWRR